MERNIGHYNITNYLNSTCKIICSTAILYFVIAQSTKLIFINQINLFPFFPAIGFATAFTIIFGRKAIFGVAIGSLLFSLYTYKQELLHASNHQVFINSLSVCLVRPLIAVINVFLVSYFTQLLCKTKYPFTKVKHILNFSISSLLGSIIAPTIGIAFIAVFSNFSSYELQLFWSNLIRGNSLGIILITPFALSWLYDTKEFTGWATTKKTEVVLLIIATLSLSLYVFITKANNESFLFFILLWAASKFGMKIITLVIAIISTIAIYCTAHHMGGFSHGSWNNNFILLQMYLLVNMISILFFKAILLEKEEDKSKLKISEEKLNIEKNILEAIIESPKGISIYSLDTNFNYLSFNAVHKNNMRDRYNIEIKTGLNLIDCINDPKEKERTHKIFRSVLNGVTYNKEEKSYIDGEYWDIMISPIKDKENNVIGATTLSKNISKLKLSEIQLEENNLSLNERIKELRCLYAITKILNRKSLSTSEKLQACAQIIPTSLQFPEKTNCRIQFREEEFFSDNFKKNDFQIGQKIFIKEEECGFIEMGYFDVKEMDGKEVFLEEEIKLLETLSDIISKSLQTKIAEENLKKSEETYRILFENVQDVFFKTSIKTKEILDVSPSCGNFNGITREELIGQQMSIIYSDKDQMQLMFNKVLTEHKIIDFNNEITIKGETFYVSINAKVICDENGEPDFVVGSLRDITERRLAGEKLKVSEENYRTLFENVQDVFFKSSLKTQTILDVSPSCRHFNGVTREELIGQNMLSIYTDENEVQLMLEKLFRENKITDYNNKIVIKEQFYHVSINASIIFDENGEPEFVVGALRDITERRLAEEKLKVSEADFRTLFENVQDVFFKTSLKTETILDVSPSCNYFNGITREELIGQNMFTLYTDENEAELMLEKLYSEQKIADYNNKIIIKGKVFYISINAEITYDSNGDPEYAIGSMRDITERRLAEENLIISEAKFRSIYENFEDVYFKTKIDGTIQELSPSFEKHFLKSCAQAIGSTVLDLYYNKKDRELLLEKLKIESHISDFDAQFIDANGIPQFFAMNAHFLYEDGIPVYIEGTLRNVNDRIASQKEMTIKNRKLEFQNTELEQFAYIASHDLQEPLITVIHCIQMLEEELGECLDEDQKHYLQFINNSTARMQLLVKGLLDYSRIGKGKKSVNINCNEIVSDVLADMNASLKESNAIIEHENLPIIKGNATEIRQLFQNLISNANKFRKNGQQPKIKLSAIKEEKNWLFSIQDNGIGIEEQNMDKVFVIFKRLHNRSEYTGTGIGLSHCKKIIEQHKGKIWAESKFSEGSTFKWTFPIEQN